MTMKYTHIGIEDQAEALKALPTVCQGIVRKPGVPEGHRSSKPVADRHDEDADGQHATTDDKSAYDTGRQKKAPSDKDGAEWRRRGSNEPNESRNTSGSNDLRNATDDVVAPEQRAADINRHQSSDDTRIRRLVEAWPNLPEHIKLAMEALCLQPVSCDIPAVSPTGKMLRVIQLDDD